MAKGKSEGNLETMNWALTFGLCCKIATQFTKIVP